MKADDMMRIVKPGGAVAPEKRLWSPQKGWPAHMGAVRCPS